MTAKNMRGCWQTGWSSCMAETYMHKTLGPLLDKKRENARAFAGLAARFSGHLREAAPAASKAAKRFEKAAATIQRELRPSKPSDKAWEKASNAYDAMEKEIGRMHDAGRLSCGIDVYKEMMRRIRGKRKSR